MWLLDTFNQAAHAFDVLRAGTNDRTFSERAVREAGVASIPVSALCEGGGPTHIVRLCFAKEGAVLDEAVVRLARFRERLTDEIG